MSSLKGWSDDHFTTDAEWVRWESNPTLHKATDLQSALTPCEISPVLFSDERLYGPWSMNSHSPFTCKSGSWLCLKYKALE